MNRVIYTCLFLTLVFTSKVMGQGSLDSLKHYSIEELGRYFERETSNGKVQFVIASEYLLRVQEDPDSLRLSKAYEHLSEATARTKESIVYANLAIEYSKHLVEKDFPAKAYFRKCAELYYAGKYAECFDILMIAKSSAEKQNSDLWKLKTSRMIAILIELTGKQDESHKVYMENFELFEKNNKLKEENPFTYLNTLFNVSDSYIRLNEFAESKIFIEKGMSLAKKINHEDYGRFLSIYSLIKIEEGQFQAANDSLIVAKSFLSEDGASYICANYILASAHLGLNDVEQATYYANHPVNLNTNHIENASVLYYKQKAYAKFIKYYRKKNNVKQELEYVLKKNAVDSTLVAGQISIANAEKIIEKIELLDSKSSSIQKLEKRSEGYKNRGIFFGLICLFSILSLGYYIKRSNNYKAKFEALMLENQQLQISNLTEYNVKKSNLTSEINEDIINQILLSLNHFEKSKKYTDNSYTLDSLAKEFNTNKSYLSKVINEHKQMNFSNYINNLRIGSIVEELKENSTLRSYTIKAIAEESGFNTSQSFSKAFHKRTGIYPSYFIKMINSKAAHQV